MLKTELERRVFFSLLFNGEGSVFDIANWIGYYTTLYEVAKKYIINPNPQKHKVIKQPKNISKIRFVLKKLQSDGLILKKETKNIKDVSKFIYTVNLYRFAEYINERYKELVDEDFDFKEIEPCSHEDFKKDLKKAEKFLSSVDWKSLGNFFRLDFSKDFDTDKFLAEFFGYAGFICFNLKEIKGNTPWHKYLEKVKKLGDYVCYNFSKFLVLDVFLQRKCFEDIVILRKLENQQTDD
jgi:hypothetical protein